jgi:Ca2+/H+ antiporter
MKSEVELFVLVISVVTVLLYGLFLLFELSGI